MTTLLALVATASAQDHLGGAWLPQDIPIQYEVSTYAEDSLPEGYPQDMLQRAYDQWTTFAPCAGVSGEFVELTEQNTGFTYDFHNRHTFDDPKDELAPGILAATVNQPAQAIAPVAFAKNGRIYKRILDSDIVFNNDVQWATEEQMNSNTCLGGIPMFNTAVHEIGHQFGMAHTCEQDEPCPDIERVEATMFWTNAGEICAAERGTPNGLDIQNMTSLYGPSAQFECSHELNPDADETIAVGNVPFDLKCRVFSDNPDSISSVTWEWGDGNTSTDVDGTHTYETAGNYSVRVCVDLTDESCDGAIQYCFLRSSYVRACAVPEPAFEAEHLEGLTYDMRNLTDLSVYGCIYEVQWDVFDSAGEKVQSVSSWEPKITFPDAGEYRVVLNVGGPAGTGAADLTFKARNGGGVGCDTGAAGGLGVALLGLVGALARRRRTV